MPKRPPKRWMRSCINQVKKKGKVRDPGAVCGSVWYRKMTPSQRRATTKKEERRKRGR
ncbi:MAG: hypothetical protein PHP08_00385 [Candidatus Dojkabacteria bacterium]|nr:hypothetical protein [Candidatus Dojkabacteria bacterium]